MQRPQFALLHALRKRAIVQWVIAYLAVAWLLLQLLSILADQFNWPLALQRGFTVPLAVGVLAAIVIGWYHGEEGRQRIGAVELIMLAAIGLIAGAALQVVRRNSYAAADALVEPAGMPRASAAPARTSIAVLPFVNHSGDRDTDYFSDGITEQLIDALANSPDLHVASRTSSFAFKGDRANVVEIGRRLQVANVLEGSVRRSGQHVRITAQLINVADGFHRFSRTFERPLGDIFPLQDEISRAIVDQLKVTLNEEARHGPPTRNIEAHDLYLRGIYHFRLAPFTSDSGIHYLERATQLDARFALAYGALARAHQTRNFQVGHRTSEYREKGFVAVEKALALDPLLAEAYVARGNMAWTIERGFDHEAATRDFRRAIELNPRLAAAHETLGAVYHHVGLNERALQEFRTGIELDPHSNFGKIRIPRVLMYQGKFAEALGQLERAPDRDTNWHWPLALWYNGRTDEALSTLRAQLNRYLNPGDGHSVYALILAGTGRAKEAEAEIAEAIRLDSGGSHFHHAAYNIASAYALMGRSDLALQWLKRVAREGFPNYELFVRDPNLNNLRRDAEFRRFLDEQRKLWEHHAAVL